MGSNVLEPEALGQVAQIQCGNCQGQLPLRMSQQGEHGAVWLCAECSVPFVSICIKDILKAKSATIRLDDRYFDTSGLPAISPKLRREVAAMTERAEAAASANEHRRSERVSRSLVVPAVPLDADLNPVGTSFQMMVANISREGIGLVHNAAIYAEYVALKLAFDEKNPIQVVVRIVRERKLESPLREFGGEFYVRLGSKVG